MKPETGFYTRAHSDSQSYDFYRAESENAPLLLYVHGGAWRYGDKESLFASENGVHRLREVFHEAGFACASINYRLSDEATFPSQIHDVKAAIRHFKKHAVNFGIDPARVVLAGGSAGGHLTQLAAATGGAGDLYYDGEESATSPALAAAVSIYGVSDLRTIYDDRELQGFPRIHPDDEDAEVRLLGGQKPGEPGSQAEMNWTLAHPYDLALSASPQTFAPTYFLHGTADSVVPPVQSTRMYEELSARGIPTSLDLVEDAEHADIRCYADPHLEKLKAWVLEQIS